MKSQPDPSYYVMNKEAQEFLDKQLIEPLADQMVDAEPPSKLEPREHKHQRTVEQLRASLRTYQDYFRHAGQLLAEANVTFENADREALEAMMKQPEEHAQKMLENGETWQDLLKLSEKDLERIYAIACEHYEHQAYENARDLFLLLTNIQPDMGIFYAGLGMTEQQCGHYEMASTLYALAAELNPEDPSVYLLAAHCLHKQNRTEEGTKVLDALVESIGEEEDWKELKDQATELKQSWSKAA